MSAFDAIVVGAGHNGLTTAAYLARAGLKVLVLERRAQVGGAAYSDPRGGGFTFTSCSYVCSLFRPEIIRDLELARHGLQILPFEGAVNLGHNGDYLGMFSDHDRTRREIARHSLRDAEAYDRFAADVLRQCRFIRPMLLETPPDPTVARWQDLADLRRIGQRFAGMGEKAMYDTMRLWTASSASFLDRYFESDLLKGAMAGSAIIGTALGPYSPGTAYVLLHHFMGDVDGTIGAWGYARGGMGAISQALAGAVRAAGGEIRTEAEVSQFLTRDDRVTGVVLADGEEIQAERVISNLDPRRTYLNLMPREALSEPFRERIENFKIRGSSGKVNIALDRAPQFTAIPDSAPDLAQGTITISPDMAYLERGYDDWKRGTWSQRPFLDISVPSHIDPSVAPPGQHTMTVFVQYVPPKLADGDWTPDKRDAFGDTVLSTIEAHAPGLRDSIVDLEVRTPHELEAEVGLTEGNIFHGELTLDQLLFNRPVPGYAQYRGPLDRFYMCGSSTHPGGGVMGAPGYNAAREVLADLKKRKAA
ncbi:MAG: NAD(P)/FAD-dependent oxidoreductase [Salinisphaera sp.]|uniref:phytoene desaturase family protein n=1 Tax=Salinisphaera sp. TaxID=1914330 RepID=UPI003C79740D